MAAEVGKWERDAGCRGKNGFKAVSSSNVNGLGKPLFLIVIH
jgi:hypothetical protein